MREFLIKILLETNQELPEFWEEFKPEDTTAKIEFDDDSGDEEDEEETENNAGGDDAWGNGDSGDNNAGANGDAWGASNDVAAAAPVVVDDWNAKPAKPVKESSW